MNGHRKWILAQILFRIPFREECKLFFRPEHPADVKREYIIEDKFMLNKWQDTFHKHRIYIPDEERYTVSFKNSTEICTK